MIGIVFTRSVIVAVSVAEVGMISRGKLILRRSDSRATSDDHPHRGCVGEEVEEDDPDQQRERVVLRDAPSRKTWLKTR